MSLQIKNGLNDIEDSRDNIEPFVERIFTKDYVDFLNEAGWRLENKLPSNSNCYSDHLEDTDWKSNSICLNSSKHFRIDLDALS